MDEAALCREIISLLFSRESALRNLQQAKIEVCRRHHHALIPKNSAILAAAPAAMREALREELKVKPSRTLSGVAPIAVMTSPAPCPHGKCLPCPGGPDHPFQSPQSYTGEEPAARRGREHNYDPATQVHARLCQLEALGHHVGKAELIVMGGTMTARPAEYQEWFVASCLMAMNWYPALPEKEDTSAPWVVSHFKEAAQNESAPVRCVALTFETRPDWCRPQHVEAMLDLGVTKVEIGVQHLDDTILALNTRGCTTADTVAATELLHDAGMKVGYHVMPNLPGSTLEMDLAMFNDLFLDPRFRPDFLKIYPTLVTPGSALEDLFIRGDYAPYPESDLIDLVARAKSLLPPYVRLQRIQRDIPAPLIVAGSRHSNFRQLARDRLYATGGRCRCIRCRECGRRPPDGDPREEYEVYFCAGGAEHFITEVAGDSLLGFARLRTGGIRHHPATAGAALLRELHVYGSMVPVGSPPHGNAVQHQKVGDRLLARAEATAREEGYDRIAVMSGVGVRPYYTRHGYHRSGPYMVRDLCHRV
jgi:elongator complex protein 3